MKVLVTGGSGILGSALVSYFSEKSNTCETLDRKAVSFSDPMSFCRAIEDFDIVVHAAANTDVEGCERDLFACYRDNSLLTELMANAALQVGNRLVYMSSTGVYGNYSNSAYTEFDLTEPTTHHHRAKLLGEGYVLRNDRALVIRTGWLFGGAADSKKNFVARRIDEARHSAGHIIANVEQKGCPTYVLDLAERIFDLVEGGFSGLFNCVNLGVATRFDYVEKILELSETCVSVSPSNAGAFKRVANVSNNESAVNLKQEMIGLPPMRNYKAALSEYIETLRGTFL